MAKFNSAINSFISGEVSPKIYGRFDVQNYSQGCEKILNMFVRPEGGALRRSGSSLLFAETLGSHTYSNMYMIPFFPVDAVSGSKYAILICGSSIADWKLLSLDSPTNPITLPLKGRVHYLRNLVNASSGGAAGKYAYTFSALLAPEIKYAQTGNVLILTHGSFPPLKIVYDPLTNRIEAMHLWDNIWGGAWPITSITIAAPGVFTVDRTDLGIVNNQAVNFTAYSYSSPPTVPGGISLNTTYFIKNRVVGPTSTTFEVSATRGGASITTTGSYSASTIIANFTENSQVDVGEAWKKRVYSVPNIGNALNRGTISATTAAVIEWSGPATGAIVNASGPIFDNSWLNTYIKFTDPSATPKSGVFYVQEIVTAYQVRGAIVLALPGTGGFGGVNSNTYWEEEEFKNKNDYSTEKPFPSAVGLYQQRAVLAGTDASPMGVWFSRLGNIYEFQSIPLQTEDEYTDYAKNGLLAFSSVIADNVSSRILWITQNKTLTIGSELREYSCATEGGLGNTLLPSFVAQSSYGSSKYTNPLRKDSSAVFIDSRNNLRDLQYNFQEDAWKSENLNLLSDHMRSKASTEYASLYSDYSNTGLILDLEASLANDLIFYSDGGGGLTAVTLKKDANITAATEIRLGGTGWSGNVTYPTNRPRIQSIMIADNKLYMSVCRLSSGGIEYQTIEVIYLGSEDASTTHTDSYKRMRFLDAYLSSSSGSAKTAWSTADSGFTYLDRFDGQTLRVFGDGFDLGDVTISAGAFTSPQAVKNISVGFSYESKLITLPINPGSPIGTAIGKPVKIDTANVLFYNTIYAEYGTEDKIYPIAFRLPTTPGGDLTPAFTGIKSLTMPASYNTQAKVIIRSSAPYPMGVSAIVMGGQVYD
jgi:hypothetical protein